MSFNPFSQMAAVLTRDVLIEQPVEPEPTKEPGPFSKYMKTEVSCAFRVTAKGSKLVRWVFSSIKATDNDIMYRAILSLSTVRSGGFKDSMSLIYKDFVVEKEKFIKAKELSVERYHDHPALYKGASAQVLSRRYNREEVQKLAASETKKPNLNGKKQNDN